MTDSFLAIYPSHDSSVTVFHEGKFRVFELERLKKQRFYRFDNQEDFKSVYDKLKEVILAECGVSSFKECLQQSLPDSHKEYLSSLFGIEKFSFVGHHISHAASSFYQSPFSEALIISYDGGGYEGEEDPDNRVTFFNVYLANRDEIKKIHTSSLNLGTGYGMLAVPISEINKTQENWGERFLGFAGKMMGLSAYGVRRPEWEGILKDYYYRPKWIDIDRDFKLLSKQMGMELNVNTLSDTNSYDLAATAQWVFEKIIWNEITPFLDSYEGMSICLAGGCALNILFNQKLKDHLDEIGTDLFVPPNPSDCGLSFGMAALKAKPSQAVNLMYSGFPILDRNKLDSLGGEKVKSHYDLIKPLMEGKIIGIMRGNSEHGPRALGNRSILCNPGIKSMKDILNSKVKYREWFRPFAPIVRDIDVSKYFEFTGESKFMSFSPKVKEEYIGKIPSIVHVDGTSRIQTVSTSDNPFIYDLLSSFEEESGFGVLLNTSFNIKGRPILTTVEDALEVLNDTELDMVLIEDRLFTK